MLTLRERPNYSRGSDTKAAYIGFTNNRHVDCGRRCWCASAGRPDVEAA